ncbi:MAG: ABC transporter ATP-binding protein [Planctomycetes bacterium]|nr:ABC transporter ATP-binding protein [Planctomycetota bacterium]
MTLRFEQAVIRNGDFALGPIEWSFHGGAVTVVIGPNGGGKSTLLRAASGLLPARSGGVRIDGAELSNHSASRRAHLLAYVPQRPESVGGFSVQTSVVLGRVAMRRDPARIRLAMERTGIAALADQLVGRLSEGQRHRVAFARALAQRTPETQLLIVDEPTSALDPGWSRTLAAELKHCAAEGLAVIVATHDFAFAGSIADHAIALSRGQVVASGEARSVLAPSILQPIFGVPFRMVDAIADRPLCIPVWSDAIQAT